jgi:ribosome biogenesis protein ERB1
VHVFHATVYSDLERNPLIVPLKILRGHGIVGNMGVLSLQFHPRQPWLFTAGADGVINMFQDI